MRKDKNTIIIVGLTTFLFVFFAGAQAAVIHLTNGKVIKGKIIERDADHVRVDIKGIQLTYFSDEIDYIEGEKNAANNIPLLPSPLPAKNENTSIGGGKAVSSPLSQYEVGLLSQMDIQDMTKRQLILALMELSGVRKNLIQTFARIKQEATPEKKEIFNKMINIDEIIQQLVPIYNKYFTKAELQQLVKFYRSEAGQKLLQVTPNILQDTMEASKMYFQKKLEEVQ